MLSYRNLFALLFVLCFTSHDFISTVDASEGDRDSHYRSCLHQCQSQCLLPVDSTKSHLMTNSPVSYISSSELSYSERLIGWTCNTNCQYLCMWHNIQYRQQYNLPIVKYYGKWPFIRVYGIQEFFSVLFSVINVIPHMTGAIQYYKSVDDTYVHKYWWLSYSVVSCNTWLWSTVFHARDTLLTERLDYFCASFGIVYASIVTVIRVLNIKPLKYKLCVLVPWLTLFILHISYLHFIYFDYGYNMTMSLLSGVLYSGIWCVWGVRHNSRPYVYKIYVCTLLLWLAALCEIFDFAPFYHLLDAHAIWHGLTPPITLLFYSFLIDDAQYELQQSTHKAR